MRTFLIVWLGILSSSLVAEARTWTDVTGEHRLDAELLSLAGSTVRLQSPAGRIYSIDLSKLSPTDRKLVIDQDRNLQPTDLAAPKTIETALQLGGSIPSGSSATSGALSDPSSGSPASGAGGITLRQNPAPLTLDSNLSTGQQPATQEAQSTPAAGSQQAAVPSKDKRIFSGCKSTFQLYSRDGTGAYWINGKHYLAKLTFYKTQGDHVCFTSSGEGGVEAWAFTDVESCGPSRIYAWMTGSSGWKLFDHDYREQPN